MRANIQLQKSNYQNKKDDIFLLIKQYLFARCYELSSNIEINKVFASILMIFQEIQLFAIVSRLSQNPTIAKSQEIKYIDAISKMIILDVDPSNNIFISVSLLIMQILTTLAILLPFQSQNINKFVSKYILYFFQMVITIPSIQFSTVQMISNNNLIINIIIYILSILNNFIFQGFIYDSSFKRQNQNVLVRGIMPLGIRNMTMLLLTMFAILQYFSTSFFMFYITAMFILDIIRWLYCVKIFLFFDQSFMNLKGFLISFNLSAYLCYIVLYMVDNAIIAENVTIFISAFSIFLAYFFKICRNNIVKNIIIYKQLKGQDQIAIYCVFYWHCFKNITQKKNQLYISSLLKRHISQCQQINCCCKNRQRLYDAELKIFGDPKIQPHFDGIFIKHFILKLFKDGYQKFFKSRLLTILLCNYIIEIMQSPPKLIQLTKKLNKMAVKNQLALNEQFAVYCIKNKLWLKIEELNLNRGNQNLEDVKQFDKNVVVLMEDLRTSIKLYHGLWNLLNQISLNQPKLFTTCKEGLTIMFKIQANYKILKKLNSQSTQLRTIMIFYAKMVSHDVHLLSEIRKEIKNNLQNNFIFSASDNKRLKLHLFGSKTVSLISYENSKIKWSSRHAHKMFEYSVEEFQSLSIKNLMPRYFADNHDKYIENWKETGYYTKLNSSTYLWGNTKSGHCFSMIMYVKMIHLHQQQQYAFFSIMQKLDDQNEIICSSTGQIYGVGKVFTDSLSIGPKLIQQMRPHIQIFIPSAFQYFFQAYYDIPKNNTTFNLKRNSQLRRQGFFPKQMEHILKIIKQQKDDMLSNENKKIKKQLLGFVKQKLQEITSCIDGQYVSFIISCQKISANKNSDYIVLKISNPKRNNVEKYYTELQAMIQKLERLNEQFFRGQKIVKTQNNRTNFFKACLNPKKMLRAIQTVQQTKSNKRIFENQAKINEYSIKSKKQIMNIVNHRKLLAISAQYQIKNQKIRYYLWKIKNALLQQGIISRYTYNLLIGKSNYAVQGSINFLPQKSQILQSKKSLKEFNYHNENIQQNYSQSIQNDSQEQLNVKQSAHQTFNSGSSSATFISMTNHVKVFKQKLKSLNTPVQLYFLNIFTIITVTLGILGLGMLMIINFPTLNSGVEQFNSGKQANFIMDTLLLGQLNIINIQNNNKPFYQFQRQYYKNKTGSVYKDQMFRFASYQNKNPFKLSYLKIKVTDEMTMSMFAFIQKMHAQILNNHLDIQQKMFKQAISSIKVHSNSNKIFINIPTNIFKYFLIYLIIILALQIITFPIIYRLQLKVFEIYKLMMKINPKERQKFNHHYNIINEEFKDINEVQEIDKLINRYQNRTKMQFTLKAEKIVAQSSKSSFKVDKSIFIKLLAVNLILISSVIFKYYYSIYYFEQFYQTSKSFTNVFNSKTEMTHHIVSSQFQLMGYKNQYKPLDHEVHEVKLTDAIYNTYHLKGISDNYKSFIQNFTSGQCCDLIAEDLRKNQYQWCKTVNNKAFNQGCFDNLYYTQRKIEQKLQQYYKSLNVSQNNGLNIHYPDYFKSEEYYNINAGYFFNSLMIFKIYDKLSEEMNTHNSHFKYQLIISNIVSTVAFLIFLFFWIYLYFKIAENSSYVNAFLLLIPYEILSQNPYIKLYIRKQFDFKTGSD